MSDSQESIERVDSESPGQQDCQELHAEIAKLKEELRGLQENTVIESMNDLKTGYETLCGSALCTCVARRLLNKNYEYQRIITAVGVSSWCLYTGFEEVLNTVRRPKAEVAYDEWIKLRNKLEHLDHGLRHVHDICEESDVISDVEEDVEACVCDTLKLSKKTDLDDRLLMIHEAYS